MTQEQAGAQRWLFWGAVAFLVLLPGFLFFPALFLGKMLYGVDQVAMAIPMKVAAERSMAAGEWPLWLPDILGGMPHIASANLMFLYPSEIGAYLAGIPVRTAIGWDAALHVALAGVGMLLFLRALGLSLAGALLGAFFFASSGAEISPSFAGHGSFIKAIALVPWAFLAVHTGQQKRSYLAWGLGGLVFALQLLSGSVQLFAFLFPATAAMAFHLAWRHQSQVGWPLGRREKLAAILEPLPGLGLALLVALLLAAPLLWPTLQYLPYSVRQNGDYAFFANGSFTLQEALTWAVPGYYGWHWPTYHGTVSVELVSEYMGLLPWALASAALLSAWQRRRGLVLWMAGLALAAFLVALGPATPINRLLFHLPIYSGFRIWSRILFLLTFAVCVLAAYGWDALQEGAEAKALRGALAFLGLVLLAALGAWWLAPASADQASSLATLLGQFGSPAAVRVKVLGLSRDSALRAMILALLLAPLLWLAVRRAGARSVLLLVLAFHACDQGELWRRYLDFVDPQRFSGEAQAAQALLPPLGPEPWRTYYEGFIYKNDPILFGHEAVGGYESAQMRSHLRIAKAMEKRPADWSRLMNVRWFLQYEPDAKAPQGMRITAREDTRALPRARLVSRARRVEDDEEAYRVLADPAFDVEKMVALAVDPGPLADPPRGRVQWLRRTPNAFSLQVGTAGAAVLLVANSWYPSWRCEVDGRSVEVLKADGGLQAVLLPAGEHRVDFRFDDGLFQAALWAALAGLVILLGLAWRAVRGRRATLSHNLM